MGEDGYPQKLYKYKSISTIDDLERILDIIENNRIYMPNREQLNDPLEGTFMPIIEIHTAGSWMFKAQHKNHSYVSNQLDLYRILSLSADERNMQMWAHYAGNYSGICIEFSSLGAFSKARPVIYGSHPNRKVIEEPDLDQIETFVEESFFHKSIGWENESEFRIITKQNDKSDVCFFKFEPSAITAIHLGHNIKKLCKDIIYKLCTQKGIPVYMTWCSDFSDELSLVEIHAIDQQVYAAGEDILKYEKDPSKREKMTLNRG